MWRDGEGKRAAAQITKFRALSWEIAVKSPAAGIIACWLAVAVGETDGGGEQLILPATPSRFQEVGAIETGS